ncbi:SDR family oxidoreductase [Emcibacter sp.]|uniref:SDR family oxidoreductase n=1 Tax=Emcibacter sp. TaxID=1979954 RepID=UPI002AA7A7B9|nr:SDR family oxidoreductase [Emcibacter sp.]
MARLEGKVAIVTGAASGLGKADAILMAKEGARIILTDINEKGGMSVAEEIGGNAIFMRQDVTKEDGWQEVTDRALKEFGRLDILVNNAGIVIVADPETTSLDQFRLANSVMSESVYLGCRYAIPAMQQCGGGKSESGGSIINMSSIASHLGFPVFFAYSAAKGAVRAMTKSVAVHCQMNGYNIRCNSLHPASIETAMVKQAAAEMGSDFETARKQAGAPGIGKPEDVANTVVFLASDESKYINGTEIIIDNALSIQ